MFTGLVLGNPEERVFAFRKPKRRMSEGEFQEMVIHATRKAG